MIGKLNIFQEEGPIIYCKLLFVGFFGVPLPLRVFQNIVELLAEC